jgi:phage recombination protein Bet
VNALTPTSALSPEFPIFAMPPAEALDVLCNSLYPGAAKESALMVLGYCRARGMDPMQKPVHIVPMDVKTGQKDGDGGDVYAKRDVVMPGIGQYRIQATQTGSYAGQDEPVYGPLQSLTYKKKVTEWYDKQGGGRAKRDVWVDAVLQYPEWCRVTVYRIVQQHRVAFTACEFWMENYGTASPWTTAPNRMWEKRIHAQLAKCAEAQALRKGFPDAVDSTPTADEMEGKNFDFDMDPAEPRAAAAVTMPTTKAPDTPAQASTPSGTADTPAPGQREAAPPAAQAQPAADVVKISEGQVKHLQGKLKRLDLSAQAIAAMLGRAGAASLDTSMTQGQFDKMLAEIRQAGA